VNAEDARLLRLLGRATLRFTAGSALLAAVGLNITVAWNGEWLALGLAFYGGAMEPNEPSLAYPILAAALPLVFSLLSLAADPILKKPWLSGVALALALAGGGVAISHLLALLELTA